MVVVLAGVHQNLCDPRTLFRIIMVSDRLTDRRCLDELGTSANYANDFHLETISKLVKGVAPGLGSSIEKNLPEFVLYHLLGPIRVLDS